MLRHILYFDTSSFASNLSCGYEVCGVTGTAKQFLFHGPGTINTDAGVEKDTKLTERMQLNFRLEMFNVFNHANFLTSATVGNANSGQFGQVTNTAPARSRSDKRQVHLLTQHADLTIRGDASHRIPSLLVSFVELQVSNHSGDFSNSR